MKYQGRSLTEKVKVEQTEVTEGLSETDICRESISGVGNS